VLDCETPSSPFPLIRTKLNSRIHYLLIRFYDNIDYDMRTATYCLAYRAINVLCCSVRAIGDGGPGSLRAGPQYVDM
jgi:hypothetical protein